MKGKYFRILLLGTLFVVLIPLLYYKILRSHWLQYYLSHKVAVYLTDQWHTVVKVGGVDFSFFNSLILENVYVEDLNCDTLAYIERLDAKLSGINFKKHKITFSKVDFQKLVFNLDFDKSDTFNLDFIINYFDDGTIATDTSTGWKFNIKNVSLFNSRFSYINRHNPDTVKLNCQVNWDSIIVRNINIEANNFYVQNSSVFFAVKHLSLTEQNGLYVKHLSGNAMVNYRKIFISGLQ